MNDRNGYKKKFMRSCLTVCMAGTLALGSMTVPAWAAPSSGTAKDDNTVVRDQIKGTAVGSLKANQEVNIKSEKKSDDGYTWYQITFDWNGTETNGWVRSDLISDGSAGIEGTVDNAGATDTAAKTNAAGSEKNNTTAGENQSGSKDGFRINDTTYQIAEKFPDAEIPEGFQAATVTCAGKEVSAAQLKSNEAVVLLYLESENDKGVYLYDSERDEAVPFVSIAGKENSFVVLTDVPEAVDEAIAGCYHRVECPFGNGSIMAYQLTQDEAQTSDEVATTDFYYLYGTSSDGQSGWYVYDAANETLQRSMENMAYDRTQTAVAETKTDEADQESVFEMDSVTKMLIGGIGLVAVLLLILAIVFSVRYRRLRRYLDDAVESDDEEEPYEAEPLPSRTIEVELKNGKVDIMDFDDASQDENKKSARKKERAQRRQDMEEGGIQKTSNKTQAAENNKPLAEAKSREEKQNITDAVKNAGKEKAAETVKTANEKKEELPEIRLPKPKKKETSPETEKLVADLKKMIREVEVTKKADEDPDEEFFDEDEEEFYDEEDTSEN